ncbi:hypothetical protein F5X99DRAFT_421688 [Biscogniauxia marginata]|nr:hypothetical protein F5X99DRAFT_421688 [Biscogniauxia marginata]
MLSNRRSTMLGPSIGTRPTSYQPSVPTLGSINPDAEPHCTAPSVLTTTTSDLAGYRIVRVVGAVYGSVTYACKDKDTKSLLKATAKGTEVRSLTHMMYNARDQAIERMTRDCVSRGANAVIGMSFGESDVLGFAQVSVYGTAVYVEREKPLENPFATK